MPSPDENFREISKLKEENLGRDSKIKNLESIKLLERFDISPIESQLNYSPNVRTTFFRADATESAFTVTLPEPQGLENKIFGFKKIDSSANALTIEAPNGLEIDGSNTLVISSQYAAKWLASNGAGYDILYDL